MCLDLHAWMDSRGCTQLSHGFIRVRQCFPFVTGLILDPSFEPRGRARGLSRSAAVARETGVQGVTPCPARSAKFFYGFSLERYFFLCNFKSNFKVWILQQFRTFGLKVMKQ